MRHLAIAAALMLSACATTGQPTPPSATVANVSYKVVGTADLAYTAAHQAAVTLVRLGKVPQSRAQALDDKAYAALLLVRQVATSVRAGSMGQDRLTSAVAALLAATSAITSLER